MEYILEFTLSFFELFQAQHHHKCLYSSIVVYIMWTCLWQPWAEIEHHFIAYFDHITTFKVLYGGRGLYLVCTCTICMYELCP